MSRAREHCVYVLDEDQGVKIGISIDLPGRVRDLERSTGGPITVFRSFPVESAARARVVEAWAHHFLGGCRTVGEWFHCHPVEAADVVLRTLRWNPPCPPIRELANRTDAA